jgi:molecular chaperone GrpE
MEKPEQQSAPEAPLTEPVDVSPPQETFAQPDNGTGEESLSTAETLSPAALQEQLEQQRQQTQEYLDHLQRLQAEFNNYRRRVSQEKLHATSRGKEDVLRALLPVLANLRLALQHAEEDAQAIRQGVQMIWQQFEGLLREQGVERINTVGQPFDPAKHEALSTAPATAEAPANTIVAEVNAGYMFDGRLLRPAQVVVARTEEPAPVAEMTAASAAPEAEV